MSKNNKGSTVLVTPFIWAITIFISIFFIVFSIRILEPFTIYQKISETALKYIFVMEEFGYLNKAEHNALKSELERKGLDINNISVYATDKVMEYGELVELNIEYKHPFKKTIFNNIFSPTYNHETLDICVSKKGVSKR